MSVSKLNFPLMTLAELISYLEELEGPRATSRAGCMRDKIFLLNDDDNMDQPSVDR